MLNDDADDRDGALNEEGIREGVLTGEGDGAAREGELKADGRDGAWTGPLGADGRENALGADGAAEEGIRVGPFWGTRAMGTDEPARDSNALDDRPGGAAMGGALRPANALGLREGPTSGPLEIEGRDAGPSLAPKARPGPESGAPGPSKLRGRLWEPGRVEPPRPFPAVAAVEGTA